LRGRRSSGAYQFRCFLAARAAPGGPEVDDDHVAAPGGGVDALLIQRQPGQPHRIAALERSHTSPFTAQPPLGLGLRAGGSTSGGGCHSGHQARAADLGATARPTSLTGRHYTDENQQARCWVSEQKVHQR